MSPSKKPDVCWRAAGEYVPNNASNAGLLYETRLYLSTFGYNHSQIDTRNQLVASLLPQRSRSSRITIVRVIQQRLTRWSPPAWVLNDLAGFAADETLPSLPAALLLHVVRQDALLYDFVQEELVPRSERSDQSLVRADVQRFLDSKESDHPEIGGWSHATREKLAGNVLSILRDYGLLQGRETKQIVEPDVPRAVASHLVRLLRAEGIEEHALARHPDWKIWLWDTRRAQSVIDGTPNESES